MFACWVLATIFGEGSKYARKCVKDMQPNLNLNYKIWEHVERIKHVL